MSESSDTPQATSAPAPTVLFDGECGFRRAATGHPVRRPRLRGERRSWRPADLATRRLTRARAEQRPWFLTAERRTGAAAAFAGGFSTGDRTEHTCGIRTGTAPPTPPRPTRSTAS
ncbi:hypothetical protein [Streptomyces sp. NPDC048191]|uniref:hypothetical protein n=1 Tax=Streptomyces sp. NPDC048191 TaxID=3155484 RepID=UPI0034114174